MPVVRSRIWFWLVCLLIALGVIISSQIPVSADVSLTDGVVKTVLSNGLTVLTKEVRTAPVATVQVWYRVGSRNERPGITGISHQLEHLLFKGTVSRPVQFGRLFNALGSNSNAFTSYDMTAYYGTVGSNKVEALLELEADRMANTRAGKEELETERTVVLSELDGGNNNPGNRLYKALTRKALAGTSYQWSVIGDRRDVENFTVEDIQAYYRSFYRPDNAVVIVVGDFDTKELLPKIKQLFEPISRPKTPIPPKPEFTPLEFREQNPIILRESGSVPFLQGIYTDLPPADHPDNPALDVMDAVLSTGRNSRFYRALVETGIATSAGGSTNNLIDKGWYFLSAVPAPNTTLENLQKLMVAEIAKLQKEGITQAELDRAKTQIKANFILSNRSINAQAQQLGYNHIVFGDYRYSDRYLKQLEQVNIQQVQRVSQKYLRPDKLVTAYFLPTNITGQAPTNPTSTEITHNRGNNPPLSEKELNQYLPKSAFSQPKSIVPARPDSFRLANGLNVVLLVDRSTPTFSLSGLVEAGSRWDTPDKAGLASLVAQNLLNGTKNQTALDIASTLENRGASLSFNAGREGTFISGYGLSADLPVVLKQLAEVLQFANFPEKEWRLSLAQNLVSLKNELDNPSALARRVFQQTLFPEGHPFHAMRTEASLKSITREDLQAFFQRHYNPQGMTLVLTGNFDPAQVRSIVETEFNWRSANAPVPQPMPPIAQPAQIIRENRSLKGKTQSVTIMGHLGISRNDPRYDTAQVLNQILGGDTLSSRLGRELRDRQGLTYGVYSFFQVGRNQGTFLIQMQTNPADTQRAIDLALSMFREITEKGVTPAEVEAAKTSLINNFPASFASPDAVASAILSDRIYGLPDGNFYTFPDRIRAVTVQQVNQVAKELFRPDNLVIVTVQPATA
jgi:zinc protease